METRRIALACFVGGALCTAVALIFSPTYWWLGLFAGLAGGYLGYEFREVLQAIPVAWRKARGRGVTLWEEYLPRIREWLKTPHPFVYPTLVLGLPIYLVVGWSFWQSIIMALTTTLGFWLSLPLALSIQMVVAFDVFFLALGVFYSLAFVGARWGERSFWVPFLVRTSEKYVSEEIRSLEEAGYQRKEPTYGNVLRWAILGLVLVCLAPAKGIGQGLVFLGRFAANLFRLIHSQKRVLCALDGTLGGTVAYFWLATGATTLGEQVVLVIFGGLLGAALGVLNYELVSKRLLRLNTV